ncbi:MAG: tetratricopeptide repeat protein [Proteobacteria bacterium]|nr:tetratricopeptide repeat protein [Pseudomonadota bacterium]
MTKWRDKQSEPRMPELVERDIFRIGAFAVSKSLFHAALLFLVSVAVYGNTFQNAFFLDDFHYILENPHIRTIHPFWRHFVDPATTSSLLTHMHYRPLLPATLSITYWLFEHDVLGYHLHNLFFHLLSTVFLYLFLVRLLSFQEPSANETATRLLARNIAFFGALIFSIHPVSGFAVNYLCGRDNLMMLAFLLISLYIYVGMRRTTESLRGWIGTLLFLALSLLSKPNGIIAPLLVLTFEIIMARTRLRSPKLWMRIGAFGVVVALFLVVRQILLAGLDLPLWGTRGDSGFDARATYLMTQLKHHLFHYLRNFAWPFRIRALPNIEMNTQASNPMMWIGAAFVLGSLAAAWLSRKRMPIISFAIFAYWLLFCLTSSVLLTHQTVADRWMYPSLPFVSIVLSYAVFAFSQRKVGLVLAIITSLYFGASTFVMNRNYVSEFALWSHSASYGTTSMGYMNLGRAYIGKDDEKARFYFEKSLEVNPNAFLTEINLGLWHINHGEKEKGIELIRKGVRDSPPTTEGESRHWLALALKNVGRHNEALKEAKKAVSLNPNSARYLYDVVIISQRLNKYTEALTYLNRLEKIQPGYNNSRFLKGWCLHKLTRIDEAIEQYKLSIEQRPRYADAYFNLGYAYKKKGRYDEAIVYFEKYLKLMPNHSGAKTNLDECKRARRRRVE